MQSLRQLSPWVKRGARFRLRLAPCHIEQLRARALTLSGTLTGVARELILTGLAGGDNKALAERLMQIERVMRSPKVLFLGALLVGLVVDLRLREFSRG